MHHSHTQRGSIIVYAMLTMAAMLAIGLTLTGLFIGKLRSAAGSRDSTTAIYTADSAVEKCLYEARGGKQADPLIFDNGATYTIASPSSTGSDVDVTNDCSVLGAQTFRFRAVGSYHGVRRALEISQ